MTPYQCPVCNGRGFVPRGLYESIGVTTWSDTEAFASAPCRSCNGKGVVWHPTAEGEGS